MPEKETQSEWKEIITNYIKDKPFSFLVTIGCFIIVGLSIVYNRYFPQTFLTLVYAIGSHYWYMARKHPDIGEHLVSTKEKLRNYLYVHINWFLLWLLLEGFISFWPYIKH